MLLSGFETVEDWRVESAPPGRPVLLVSSRLASPDVTLTYGKLRRA